MPLWRALKVYGSSRLGINTKKVDMLNETQEDLLTSYTGEKLYEMSNHLGNVLTVINDIKVPYLEQDNLLFKATIVSTADYSPFGVQLDERTVSAETYLYGFQGQEKDDEIKGAGNSVNYTYRMHDPRLGRFFAVDPLAAHYSYNSPYAFSENVVINAVELEGLERRFVYNVWYDKNGEKQYKPSHTTIDTSSDVDVRVYRYFDGNGNVTRTVEQPIQGEKRNVAWAQGGMAKVAASESYSSSSTENTETSVFTATLTAKAHFVESQYGVSAGASASMVEGKVNGSWKANEQTEVSGNLSGSIFNATADGRFGAAVQKGEQLLGLNTGGGVSASVLKGDLEGSGRIGPFGWRFYRGMSCLCRGWRRNYSWVYTLN